MSKESQTFSIPSAIVLGSVIIGIALIIAFGDKNNSPTASSPDDPRVELAEAAKQVGVKERALFACLDQEQQSAKVAEHAKNAQETGGRGTPHSILIGPDGQTVTVAGAQSLEAWNQAIDALLAGTVSETEGDLSGNVLPVTENDYIRGNTNAPVTIVEYSDIDCPFCKRLHPVLQQLITERPDDVRWVYRHWPIPQLHPNATLKAEAAECVGAITGNNDTYWTYLDLLIAG